MASLAYTNHRRNIFSCKKSPKTAFQNPQLIQKSVVKTQNSTIQIPCVYKSINKNHFQRPFSTLNTFLYSKLMRSQLLERQPIKYRLMLKKETKARTTKSQKIDYSLQNCRTSFEGDTKLLPMEFFDGLYMRSR